MSENSSADEYISAAAAAAILRRSDRQLRRWAKAGRIAQRRFGNVVKFKRGDIEQLAEELGSTNDPHPVELAEIVPSGDLMRRIDALSAALSEAQQRAASAETALRLLPPPEEARRLEAEAAVARAEVEQLRSQLTREQQSNSLLIRLMVALVVALLCIAIVAVILVLSF